MPLRSFVAGAAVLACATAGVPRQGSARIVAIDIRGFAFVGAETTAVVDDSVVWTNRDALPHTATADSGAWSSPELAGGSRFVFVPKRAGRYAYHCAAHPVMKGVLLVRE
jgi:plastocyanin